MDISSNNLQSVSDVNNTLFVNEELAALLPKEALLIDKVSILIQHIAPPKMTLHNKIFIMFQKWSKLILADMLRLSILKTKIRYLFLYIKKLFPRRWRQIVKHSLLSEEALATYSIVKASNVSTIEPVIFSSQSFLNVDLAQKNFLFPEIFVTKLGAATIHGGTNLILINANGKVICHDLYDFDRDYTSEELHGRIIIDPNNNRIHWGFHDKDPEQLIAAASFVDACSMNYAHCLTEVLPKILLFCSDHRFKDIPIVINDGLPHNLMTAISLVVDSNRNIIVLPADRALAVKQLYLMSPTGYIPFQQRPKNIFKDHSHGIFSPAALKMLRERLIEKADLYKGVNFPPKIYLRRSSRIRKLINEAEIEALLIERGFSIIETQDLTIFQQIALFKSVKVVVGATGAALANIIFSNPSTNIAILMAVHKEMPYSYWLNIASTVGVNKVSYILGHVVQHKKLGIHGDYQIQITDLLNYLNSLES